MSFISEYRLLVKETKNFTGSTSLKMVFSYP